MRRSVVRVCWLSILPVLSALAAQGPGQVPGQASGQGPGQASPAGSPAAPVQAQPDVYKFGTWQADFPIPLDLPQRSAGRWYDRTRRQALEQVVAHLQGNVRPEVWHVATEFFYRAPPDAVEPLIEAMDRAYPGPVADIVKNTIEAMGKMANEAFDDPIRRALEHPSAAVQQAAYAALATSGKVETIRLTFPYFLAMDGRARQSWLRAARVRMGDEGVAMLQKLMQTDMPTPIRDMVLKEALLLPMAQASKVLAGRWDEAVGDFKAIIAGVLHAAGDARGTIWLGESLRSDDVKRMVLALQNLDHGVLGELRNDVLRLSAHGRSEVRMAVLKVLLHVTGEDIERTLETFASPDEVWEIRTVALRELVKRGRRDAVTILLDEVPTATGTRLELLLRLVAASGDDRGVPLFAERFAKSAPGEGRQFLQAMGLSGAAAAAKELFAVFLAPERAVQDRDKNGLQLTTVNYVPTLLMNLRGSEAALLAYWTQIPKTDLGRRGYWLNCLAGIAADREKPEIRQPIEALLREVLFDAAEQPQLRILALNLLCQKSITVDDVMRLKGLQRTEGPSMRNFVSDFLLEYF